MRGSSEWRSLVEQELAELTHLLDRKADKTQLTKYVTSPESNFPAPISAETEADIIATFSAFNRVARQKLDTSTLAEFAGVSFVDSRYQKRSVMMSAHLTESCTLYYQLFDMKITELEQNCREFQVQCRQKLSILNERVKRLQGLIKKLLPPVQPMVRPVTPTQALNRTMVPRVLIDDVIVKNIKTDMARTMPLQGLNELALRRAGSARLQTTSD
jgi:hypothetical protein